MNVPPYVTTGNTGGANTAILRGPLSLSGAFQKNGTKIYREPLSPTPKKTGLFLKVYNFCIAVYALNCSVLYL